VLIETVLVAVLIDAAKFLALVALHELSHFVILKAAGVEFTFTFTKYGIGFRFDETKYPRSVVLCSLIAPVAVLPLAVYWGPVFAVSYVVGMAADILNFACILLRRRAVI